MDVILELADDFVLDGLWAKLVPSNATSTPWLTQLASSLPKPLQPPPISTALPSSSSSISAWPRKYVLRQLLSVSGLTALGIVLLYFSVATLSYYFIFDHRMMRHPRFLKDQIKLEIQTSVSAFPGMIILTLPWFQGEVMGYSRLYANVDDYGIAYLIFSVPFFLLFTDYCIYWIHRWLHVPFLYKYIHKPHHKWIIPTPFASHAFHPVDGYSQSIPYHLFVYLFPMHRYLYLVLFVAVNFWSIFIHDSDMIVSPNSEVEKYINTPAHHTLHHIYFTCNYGQYFTWADRAGGSYRAPRPELDPLREVLTAEGASLSAPKGKQE